MITVELDHPQWMLDAACADGSVDARLFDFHHRADDDDSNEETRRAKRARHARAAFICAECPALVNCDKWAESHHRIDGVLGGALWKRGSVLAGRSRRRTIEPAVVMASFLMPLSQGAPAGAVPERILLTADDILPYI